ncbi:MAG: hypothetical protein ACU85E_14050 [Gammaproteobacteria bacterium]
MLSLVVQFLLGLFYANAGEWLMHKYLLHAVGKKPDSIWAYHLHEHHAVCTRLSMLDPGYRDIDLSVLNTQTKELIVLAGIVLMHVPLFPLIPVFTGTLYASIALYYYLHRKAHLDPIWARRHLRWHYEHHMGGHPGANYCITWPLFDHLCNTRVKSKRPD